MLAKHIKIPVIWGDEELKVFLIDVLCNMKSVGLNQIQISLKFFLVRESF